MTAKDAERCLKRTGANGVMYARGALADPRIFAHDANRRRLAAGLPMLPVPAVCDVIRRHAALCREYADDRRALLRMRTSVPRYLRELPGCRALRDRLCHCNSWEALQAIVDEAEQLATRPDMSGDFL